MKEVANPNPTRVALAELARLARLEREGPRGARDFDEFVARYRDNARQGAGEWPLSFISELSEAELRREWEYELTERERRAASHLEQYRATMPRRAASVAFEISGTGDVAIAAIAKWMSCADSNIAVLTGPVGTGKTVAACWWALHSPSLPVFVRATEIASTSRYGTERDRWLSAWALIVDDLGTEYLDSKGSLLTDLDELIDVFYADTARRLVITTNLPPKALGEHYGNRVADRLRECATVIPMTGESRRRRAQ